MIAHILLLVALIAVVAHKPEPKKIIAKSASTVPSDDPKFNF